MYLNAFGNAINSVKNFYLTLTRVVFECVAGWRKMETWCYLTLTRVVFELLFFIASSNKYKNLTLTRVVFE